MRKKVKIVSIFIFSLFLFTGCFSESLQNNGNKTITFMLDWTPNTNHTGIFVAKEKGFYEELGIDIDILTPPEDTATLLVANGKADFGISFQDSIALALNQNSELPIVTVATLIQHNTSGLISLKQKEIETFKDLEGKIYATWGNDIEQAIIRTIMEKENADFGKVNLYYSTVLDSISAIQTNVDLVWVYEAWDAIIAEILGIDCNFLRFSEYEPLLDFYTPVLIANQNFLNQNEELAKKFLSATKKGYEFAIENPKEAAEILHKYSPEYDLEILIESQKYLANEYKAEVERWGYIDRDRWNGFFSWLYQQGIIQNDIIDKGFSNYYLP